MEDKIVPVNNEALNEIPVGLKYFRAVDTLIGDAQPDGSYYNIVVRNLQSEPKVIILRIQNNYAGGIVGKQDEIEVIGKKHRKQFNAECGANGDYLEFPKKISEEGQKYLNEVVGIFNDLVKTDGSSIEINRSTAMIAKNGYWVEAPKTKRAIKPKLEEPKKQLPE